MFLNHQFYKIFVNYYFSFNFDIKCFHWTLVSSYSLLAIIVLFVYKFNLVNPYNYGKKDNCNIAHKKNSSELKLERGCLLIKMVSIYQKTIRPSTPAIYPYNSCFQVLRRAIDLPFLFPFSATILVLLNYFIFIQCNC